MLFGDKTAVCSGSHSKRINAVCGQKLGFLNLKPMSVVTTWLWRRRWLERVADTSI